MGYRYLTTEIHLPDGVPSVAVVREFLQLVFAEYRWFRPTRYARASLDKPLDPGHIDYEALIAYYERYENMTIAARTDRDFIQIAPSKPLALHPPYVGAILWETSVTEAKKPAWRAAHQKQVWEIMRLFNSPLAQTGTAEDFEQKTRLIVPNEDGFGSRREFTVRSYGQGLAGLFWRNFFGPPFIQMFGERLSALPEQFRQDLGNGITRVQPYVLPTEAGTPEGIAHERQLISLLGPECFYDHERHAMPSRVPELPLPATH